MKARRGVLSGLAVSVAFVFALAPPAGAQVNDDVTNTKHNLSVSSGGNDPTSGNVLEDYGEICVYCHTPHGGQVEAPLWNRNFSTATYQMYASATPDMAADGQPTGISQACLSCHDGTVALGDIAGEARPIPMTGAQRLGPMRPGFIGTDLSGSHPVSFVVPDGEPEDVTGDRDLGMRPRSIVEQDPDIKLDEASLQAGGLHVISCEKNISARIDRQLAGRCGRQGDPGSYEAMLSLEDDFVAKRFGRMAGALARLNSGPKPVRPQWVARRLMGFTQAVYEFSNRQIRNAMMKVDKKREAMLAFSGRSE